MQRLGRNSPRLKELRQRVRDRRPGEVVVDGRRLITDLVRWGVPLLELYLVDGTEPDPAVVAAALSAWQVDPSVFEGLTPTRHPQGVLAVVPEPAGRGWTATSSVALFLEGVQDPGNLGAIVRSAAGLGAAAVLLSAGCADPFQQRCVGRRGVGSPSSAARRWPTPLAESAPARDPSGRPIRPAHRFRVGDRAVRRSCCSGPRGPA
jgi:TrmH family RNA methyltransferase